MKLIQLPHWAVDRLELYLPGVIEDNSATASCIEPDRNYKVTSAFGNFQLTHLLRQPIPLFNENEPLPSEAKPTAL